MRVISLVNAMRREGETGLETGAIPEAAVPAHYALSREGDKAMIIAINVEDSEVTTQLRSP